jgi:hypothetical protein
MEWVNVQISSGERRKGLNQWLLKHDLVAMGYFFESAVAIVNDQRVMMGFEPLGKLVQLWGVEGETLWDQYRVVRREYLSFLPPMSLTGMKVPHPMAFPMWWRLIHFTPENRAAARLAMTAIMKDIGLPPAADVYAPLGGNLEIMSRLVKVARSIRGKRARQAFLASPAGEAYKVSRTTHGGSHILVALSHCNNHRTYFTPSISANVQACLRCLCTRNLERCSRPLLNTSTPIQ